MKALVLAGFSLALLVFPATQVSAAAGSSRLAYHWPVKPFYQQHPVRGTFGDPRIAGSRQPFGQTGPTQVGGHSFHNGVDIAAPAGTRVYPVVSGRVARAKAGQIIVRTRDGRSFQYYHLTKAPAVRVGKTVVARRTILGWIRSTYEHVHLAEIDGSVVRNPLDPGHLEPYRDSTTPLATGLYVHAGLVAHPLGTRALRPGDELAVAAADAPTMRMPGQWDGLPQTPALVEWRLFRGQTATAWRIALDFRHTQPPPSHFWEVYGAGTYQSCPTFAGRIYHGLPGRYLFRLHIRPDRLQPGPYRLSVRVADTHGNRSTTRWPLVIVD
ncbi:MAG TPA: M23 family metallopeptidase [Gaiellaceae bacterium]|jgi:hypothetical protein|nr:M23 family metallopeptidase [Gaiellaceae bacterium]